MITAPNFKYDKKFNKRYAIPQNSKTEIRKNLGISEEFCNEFHKVVQTANLEIKNGKKPEFVKIA